MATKRQGRDGDVMVPATGSREDAGGDLPVEPSIMLWVGIAVFIVTMAVAYRPSFDTPLDTAAAIVPWLIGAGLVVGLGLGRGERARWLGTAVVLAGWLFLVADDPRWSVLSFVAFALCYEAPAPQPVAGLAMAAALTVAWAAAWLVADPGWIVAVPVAVYLGSAAIAALLTRERQLIENQADLIRRLQQTQADLAVSERTGGVLAERARLAGEIHDTLAQGFTSIVLLSRNARRRSPELAELAEIEAAAQHNLDAARRLVSATGPAELASVSLPAAIEQVVAATVDGSIDWRFELVGEPLPLAGNTEVAVLRTAQEAVTNAKNHANATSIVVGLSYGNETVELEVVDDGMGFSAGDVSDRGSLTGGQGLHLLAERAATVGGHLDVSGAAGTGTALRLAIPMGGS